jgi:predicted porin
MRIAFKPLTAALAVVGFACGAAHGQSMPRVKLSGFGTLAATHSSEGNADFVTNRVQPNGAGASRSWSATTDSKVGVQGDVVFSERLSGVVQLVSQHGDDNNFMPQLEWANLKYQVTPDLSVRVGRTAMPFFLYSDTRLVGYAQPWVRPPLEAYIIQPNTKSDGIDVMYRTEFGGLAHNLQAFYGANKVTTASGEAKGPVNWGLNDTAQMGDLTLRAAYTYSRVSIPSLDALNAGFAAFSAVPGPAGAEAARLAATYYAKDMDFRTLALGASYDPGRWFLTGEYINFRGSGFIRGTQAWYVSGGYRLGSFTPYLTYANSKNHTRQEAGIPLPAAAPLNAALAGIVGNSGKQETVSLGLRWDFARNTDAKVQYDRVNLGTNSMGYFTNPTPSYKPGGSANIVTVSVDFVF